MGGNTCCFQYGAAFRGDLGVIGDWNRWSALREALHERHYKGTKKMAREFFEKVVTAVRPFRSFDLLTSVAALQLVPENASQTIRLETLAHAVASLDAEDELPMARSADLHRLCNGEPLAESEIIRYEDPPERHLTEPLGWRRQSYVALAGIADDSVFTFRHLLRALDTLPEFLPDAALLNQSSQIATAVLTLSDAIARRAGLGRWTKPGMVEGRDTVIPADDRRNELRGSVAFTRNELDEMLGVAGGVEILGDLVSELGRDTQWAGPRAGGLLIRPIVRHGEHYVVSIPGMLLDAARHRIVAGFVRAGVARELAWRYRDALWRTVNECLSRMRIHRVSQAAPVGGDVLQLRRGLFGHDRDELTPVIVLSDALSDYDVDAIYSHWPLAAAQPAINQQVSAVERHFEDHPHPPRRLVTLVVIQGIGRSWAMADIPSSGPLLALTCAELEWISWIEGGESLALAKYAAARDRFRQRVHFMATSQLDEFELYRGHKHTFYLSDKALPDGITIEVGTGLQLRMDVAEIYDPHFVPDESNRRLVQVVAYFGKSIPVYADFTRAGRQPAILVEELPIPVWVVGPPERRLDDAPYSLHAEMAQSLGYWIWQFTAGLREPLKALRDRTHRLLVSVTLAADILEQPVERDEPPFVVTADTDTSTITIRLNASAQSLFSTPDNRGERSLMAAICDGIRSVLPNDRNEALSPEAIGEIVDRFAPLGSKKHFFMLEVGTAPNLDGSSLPTYRPLQDADVEGLLDELGEHLVRTEQLPEGPIASEQRTEILNRIVGFFYDLLRREVAALNPADLIEFLVQQHEATVHASALRRLTVSTRLACFSSVPEMVEKLTEEIPKLARTSMAGRFLIEYVAATPPIGARAISFGSYDRLLAVSHHIINFGFISEAIHLKLANTGLAILPSGRLGVEKDEYLSGLRNYAAAISSDVLARSTRHFEGHWLRGAGGPQESLDDLDDPSRLEFSGLSLRELVDVMMAAVSLGHREHGSVVVTAQATLADELARRLEWPAERVTRALAELTLEPRPDFLTPAAPHARRDVYPWKFSRSLSYLRRPFVLVTLNGEACVAWGFRHVFEGALYLLAICTSGRLLARTTEMRSAMNTRNDRRGREFNQSVANVLTANHDAIVRTRVTRFGALKVPKHLGDLDVIVLDAGRHICRVIECKDLALARTPDELSHQISKFVSEDGGDGPATTQHKQRIQWVQDHLSPILEHFNLASDGWSVEGMLVVDEPLLTSHLRTLGLTTLSIEELRAS